MPDKIIVSAPGPQGPAGAGGSGSISDGDKGDLTVSGGGTVYTIDAGVISTAKVADAAITTAKLADDAVTFDKMQNVTGPALVGRSASTSGSAEAIGLGTGLSIDGSKNLTITAAYAQQSVTMTAGTGLTGGGDLSANRTFAVAYGTSASTACEGNDSRLSDARTPTAHTHALADLQQGGATTNQVVTWNGSAWVPSSPSGTGTVTSVTGGTGLSGGTITTSGTLAVSYGTSAGTACEGNDSRLSDARTPTAHTHALADIQQGGATSGQVLEWSGTAWAPATLSGGGGGTVTSVTAGDGLLGGTITASGTIDVNFGNTGNTVCEGNDQRLSDARTPTAHTHGLTDSYVGEIAAAANQTYTIDRYVAVGRTITDIRIQSTSGTCTAAVKNGANTVGTVSVSSTSGGSSPSLSNATVSQNGAITLEISSNSSAVNVSFAIRYTALSGAIS